MASLQLRDEATPQTALTEGLDATIFNSLRPEDREKEFGEVEDSWRKFKQSETTDFCAERSCLQPGKSREEKVPKWQHETGEDLCLSGVNQLKDSCRTLL